MHGDQVQAPAAPAASTAPRTFADQAEACRLTCDKAIQSTTGGVYSLFVHIHHPSSLYGIVTRPMDEVPMEVAEDIRGKDWTHPLLQEMRREAMDAIYRKALAAYDLAALAREMAA